MFLAIVNSEYHSFTVVLIDLMLASADTVLNLSQSQFICYA